MAARRGRPRVYTDAELLRHLRDVKRAKRRVPTMADFGPYRDPGLPSAQTYVKRYGSWGSAVEAAGMDRPGRGPRKGR